MKRNPPLQPDSQAIETGSREDGGSFFHHHHHHQHHQQQERQHTQSSDARHDDTVNRSYGRHVPTPSPNDSEFSYRKGYFQDHYEQRNHSGDARERLDSLDQRRPAMIRSRSSSSNRALSARSISPLDDDLSFSVADAPPFQKSKYRKRSRGAAPENCHSCGALDTPEWRRGPEGVRTLCNACGLHYSKMVRKRKLKEIENVDDRKVLIGELRESVLASPPFKNDIPSTL
ncbi:hypothetical protein CBS101457_005461 [Exobasidium rhododendri]|nr:hypothetical protein CBS101457_005461 [Exobasidium rhododendri]